MVSFTAVNLTYAADTAVVTVVPTANGCSGASGTVKVVVNPTPTTTLPAPIVVCNGAATSATVFITGPVSGSSFAWEVSNATLGLPTAGTDSVPVFTAVNTTFSIDTAIITITPTANGCTGWPLGSLLVINPTPDVVVVADQSICNTASSGAVNFAGDVANTGYNWTNTNSTIGLPAAGTGTIAAFTSTNGGTITDTAIVTVTPSANGCTGAAQNFKFIVFPTPVIEIPASDSVCNATIHNTVSLSGPVAGSSFIWSANNVSIGIAATGTDSVVTFTAVNTGTGFDSSLVTVTPSANGCTGVGETFMITVKPTPKLNTSLNDTICSELSMHYVPESATAGTNYIWRAAAVNHVSPTGIDGVDSILAMMINDTLVAIPVNFVYTLTANGCSNTETVSVVINPAPHAPAISIHAPSDVCSNTLYQNFGAAVAAYPGENYGWSAVNAQVWATGSTRQYSLVNFPEAGAASVILTVNMDGVGCYHSDTVAITVGTGVAQSASVFYYNNNFVCLLNDQDSYQWGYDDLATLDSTLIPGETNQNYYNPSPDTHKAFWVMTKLGDCMEKSYASVPTSVANTVAPSETLSVFPNPATYELNISVSGTIYEYTSATITDAVGRILKTVSLQDNKATIAVENLAPGVYSVNCSGNGIRTTSVKFVKN